MIRTPRDRWIATFLPALLAAILYVWVWDLPGQRERAALEKSLAGSGTERKSEEDLKVLRAKVTDLETALRSEKHAGTGTSSVAGVRTLEARSAAEQFVTAGISRQQLQLLGHVALDGKEAEAALEDVRPLALALTNQTGALPARVLKLKLSGTFPALVRWVRECASATHWAVPVKIGMDPGERDGEWTWSILLWI